MQKYYWDHYAKILLGSLVGEQIELVHADATTLPFPCDIFDGIWTVQALQHIPSYIKVFHESYRVLKKNAKFINYSLHITPITKLIYSVLGKDYHEDGDIKDLFYLRRANKKQKEELSAIFNGDIVDKYCECFFHPDLRLTFTGKEQSWMGKLDYYFGSLSIVSRLFARQRGFEVIKL